MFYNISDGSKKLCRISQHCKSSQTESACIATSKCIKVTQHNVTPTRHETHVARQKCWLNWSFIMSRDKSVDLTGVLSCLAILFECLRHNLLSLRHVSSMWRHKPDLLLFRSIAGNGDVWSKDALVLLYTTFLYRVSQKGTPVWQTIKQYPSVLLFKLFRF